MPLSSTFATAPTAPKAHLLFRKAAPLVDRQHHPDGLATVLAASGPGEQGWTPTNHLMRGLELEWYPRYQGPRYAI